MKNKKRLLVAVAAMSAFGIAAGTVSTFAWFQINNTVNAHAGDVTHGGVTVNAPSAETTSFVYNITATAVLQNDSKYNSSAKALVLTTENGTHNGYDTKVWNTAGDLVNYSEFSSTTQALYLVYDVVATGSWSGDASGLTANEKHKLLSETNETYTLTYTIDEDDSDARARIASSMSGGLFVSEKGAGVGLSYSALNVQSFAANADNNETLAINEYTGEGVSITIGQLYVRVEGGKENEDAEDADDSSIAVVINGSAVTSITD